MARGRAALLLFTLVAVAPAAAFDTLGLDVARDGNDYCGGMKPFERTSSAEGPTVRDEVAVPSP